MSNILSVHFQKLLAASFPTSLLPPPPARNGVAREAGFSFPGGGGVDRALRPDPPPPKRGSIDGTPKIPKNQFVDVRGQSTVSWPRPRAGATSTDIITHVVTPHFTRHVIQCLFRGNQTAKYKQTAHTNMMVRGLTFRIAQSSHRLEMKLSRWINFKSRNYHSARTMGAQRM